MSDDAAELWHCDEPGCDRTWPRHEMTTVVLREIFGTHLWLDHAIRAVDAGDRLPMTDEEVAWVRAQRR
jgi:hypothetical protein